MDHSHSQFSAHESTSPCSPSTPHNSCNTFAYTPLSHPRHFRLLQLKRPVGERPEEWKTVVLRGTIVETSLDNVPEYFAISYTWGDPPLSDVIFIDERALKITQSCAAALRRMLKGEYERTIWIDSICINQASMCRYAVSTESINNCYKVIRRRSKKEIHRLLSWMKFTAKQYK